MVNSFDTDNVVYKSKRAATSISPAPGSGLSEVRYSGLLLLLNRIHWAALPMSWTEFFFLSRFLRWQAELGNKSQMVIACSPGFLFLKGVFEWEN